MSNFINEIKKDGIIYDVRDKRADGIKKLYRHSLYVVAEHSGSGECATSPFNFISTRPTAYTLLDLAEGLFVGEQILSLCDDDGVLGSSIQYFNNTTLRLSDYKGITVDFENITTFEDTVIEF